MRPFPRTLNLYRRVDELSRVCQNNFICRIDQTNNVLNSPEYHHPLPFPPFRSHPSRSILLGPRSEGSLTVDNHESRRTRRRRMSFWQYFATTAE